MFRQLSRSRQKLSERECYAILTHCKRGVLSVLGENGYPYGMPMNHWYDERNGKIYFHCGKTGHRLDAIQKEDKVSYCVYNDGICEDGDWARNFKSVILFGRIRVIEDVAQILDICERLSYKFTDDVAYIEKELAQSAKNTLLLEVTVEHICGKKVKEA